MSYAERKRNSGCELNFSTRINEAESTHTDGFKLSRSHLDGLVLYPTADPHVAFIDLYFGVTNTIKTGINDHKECQSSFPSIPAPKCPLRAGDTSGTTKKCLLGALLLPPVRMKWRHNL